MLSVGLFLVLYLLEPANVPWSISNGRLQIHSSVWNAEFPLSDLEISQARILELGAASEWMPYTRHGGYNGVKFDAGRFELRNGNRVDLYLANESKAVVIPRRGNVPVMVGVNDPVRFLNELKAVSTR